MTATNPISDNMRREIEVRAYHIWESEGRPQGREREHWRMAESEILGTKPAKKARPGGSAKANTAESTAATASEATAATSKSRKTTSKAAPAEKAKAEKTKKTAKPKTGKPA